jgi:hypothetical protein
MATLAIAAPVAGASAAQSTSGNATLAAVATSSIPCYPYPAFCGPNGQPWFPFLGRLFNLPGTIHILRAPIG